MPSFRVNQIAKAQNKGAAYKVPDELDVAYLLDKTGWDYLTLQATPESVINKLRFLWHLQAEAQKAQDRIAKRKPS